MNYENLYQNFISNRQNRTHESQTKYEKHHIIPRSCGGTDDDSNIVLLTPAEHFFAHKLLVKIYEQRKDIRLYKKMLYAVNMMCVSPNGVFRVNHKRVGWLRDAFIKHHPMKNPEVSRKTSEGLKKYYSSFEFMNAQLEKINGRNIFPFCEINEAYENGTWRIPVATKRQRRSAAVKERTSRTLKNI